MAAIPFTSLTLWSASYLICNITVTMYALFFLSIIAGQWFPRRKGTVMGIATIAYPVFNGVIGLFASAAMAPLATGGVPAVFTSFLPFLIMALIGVIGLILMILFSAGHVKKTDDKYREKAGKPLDDVLSDRK